MCSSIPIKQVVKVTSSKTFKINLKHACSDSHIISLFGCLNLLFGFLCSKLDGHDEAHKNLKSIGFYNFRKSINKSLVNIAKGIRCIPI